MRLPSIAALASLCATVLAAPPNTGRDLSDKDPMTILKHLNKQALKNLEGVETDGECTLENATRRKDWNRMKKKERKDYIKAVRCLFDLSSVSRDFAAGARTRHDDFVATHINQTRQIHQTGNFLTWHRYFVWTYEQTLRNECGYKGAQPYWNWVENADDLTKSPVFDGSETSLGSDGEYFEHNGVVAGAPGRQLSLPSGNGGGCLKAGPFSDITINLGPVVPGMQGYEPISSDPYAHNPRCLRRDLTSYATSNWMTSPNLLNITIGAASSTIQLFQDELQGRFADGFLGMHSSGHFAAGGDASDFFTSTNDPSFFLHHAMVDRVYWLWQSLHLDRAGEIAGTITMADIPPSRDAEVTDELDMKNLEEPITIADALSTMRGKFCYVYV
ncbi:Di-copper centre-containing protein [Sarocladium strictum]